MLNVQTATGVWILSEDYLRYREQGGRLVPRLWNILMQDEPVAV